jgi:hypothetical protein
MDIGTQRARIAANLRAELASARQRGADEQLCLARINGAHAMSLACIIDEERASRAQRLALARLVSLEWDAPGPPTYEQLEARIAYLALVHGLAGELLAGAPDALENLRRAVAEQAVRAAHRPGG